VTTEAVTIAALLESAADRIDAAPGTNVLDALRESHLAHGSDDTTIADTYYTLLAYLPVGVTYLAPWSDHETPDRVAGKLRQCARTTRRGGPHRVEDHAPPVTRETDLEVVQPAGSRHRGHKHQRGPAQRTRRPESEWARDAQLRLEIGRTQSALVRMRRGKHPNPTKITAAELRLAEAQRELAQLEGDPDGIALALIAESQAFPADHDPTRNGYQRVPAGSMSGL